MKFTVTFVRKFSYAINIPSKPVSVEILKAVNLENIKEKNLNELDDEVKSLEKDVKMVISYTQAKEIGLFNDTNNINIEICKNFNEYCKIRLKKINTNNLQLEYYLPSSNIILDEWIKAGSPLKWYNGGEEDQLESTKNGNGDFLNKELDLIYHVCKNTYEFMPAIKYIEDYRHENDLAWRLPTKEELISLYEKQEWSKCRLDLKKFIIWIEEFYVYDCDMSDLIDDIRSTDANIILVKKNNVRYLNA